MRIEIVAEERSQSLAAYATISIAFKVERLVDVESLRPGSGRFDTRVNPRPYAKDYDAAPNNGPLEWPKQFDLSRWGVFGAFIEGRRVGGVAVATDEAPGLRGSRDDIAVLWDLRVDPAARRHGVGSALLSAAEQWMRNRSMSAVEVETQNVNVPACRFYAKHGFIVHAVNRVAYPAFPDEVQLVWQKTIAPVRPHP